MTLLDLGITVGIAAIVFAGVYYFKKWFDK